MAPVRKVTKNELRLEQRPKDNKRHFGLYAKTGQTFKSSV